MPRLLLWLLALGWLAASADAQSFKRFGVGEGLPSDMVNDVETGPDGLLWVATSDGLARYDGYWFRVWRRSPGGLASSQIAAVAPQTSGAWAGTAAGLAWVDRFTGRATMVADLPAAPVRDVVVGAEGQVWVGYTGRGLWRYQPGQQRPAEGRGTRASLDPASGAFGSVVTLASDGQNVWAEVSGSTSGEGARICRIRATGECERSLPVAPWRLLEGSGASALVYAPSPQEPARVEWLGTDQTWEIAASGLLWESFRSVLKLDRDRAWVRTSTALLAVGAGGQTETVPVAVDRRDGLGGYDARAFALDHQGNAWVATEAGLYLARRPAAPFAAFRRVAGDPTSLSDDRINGVSQAADGALWVATNDGLNRLDLTTGRAERAPAAGGVRGFERAFWQALPLPDGRVVVGRKRGGVGVWDGRHLRRVPGGPSGGIRSLALDASGDVWIASAGGLWRVGTDGTARPQAPPAPGSPTNVLHVDDGDQVWAGTDAGLYRLAPGEPSRWVPVAPEALCAPIVWSMTKAASDPGTLWVATVGGGLARVRLADETVRCVTAADGLPTDAVYGVLADDDGHVWASTLSGLARLDPATGDVATFSSADGLAGDAFNLMSQLRLSDGRLAFGGPSGLTIVDPRAVERRRPPQVVLTGVERQGRLLPGLPRHSAGSPARLRLSHDAASFGVRFSAVDFRAPRRSRYRYRLAGLDDQWHATDGSLPRAAYAGVPPGEYRFEVVGAAADSPFSETPAVLVVEVVPALWQRASFWIVLGTLALGLSVGAVSIVQRRRRAESEREAAEQRELRRRLARAREGERVRLARDLHDGPVQTLYRVGHDLDELGAGDRADAVRPVRSRVGDVAGELRQMLVELRPTLVEHLGLAGALRSVARNLEDRFPDLTVDVEGRPQNPIPRAHRLALFRIAQEAMQNAGRHAGPALVTVRLADAGRGIRLTVSDDGRGFDVPRSMIEWARAEHFGLVGAQEQAEAVGGTFAVRSAPGAGATVEAWVPG